MCSQGLLDDLQSVGHIIAAGGIQDVFGIGVWLMAAVIAGIAGIYLVRFVRQWTRKSQPGRNFTLQELREMRQAGQLSDTEFNALKGQVIRGAAEVKATDEIAVGDQIDGEDAADGADHDPEPD